ncbi:FecR domain-containing protein [Flammeovirga sp. OC4]|uniref:FecR domain-containing protein n=1 Tax=Flammeovirga sp. OC4 TaxID=1382345 RepID=UPI0005C59FA4|nr:FecR family protein [Flammeovirga sp. OC4]
MSENDFISKGNEAFKDGKKTSLELSNDKDGKLLEKISDYTNSISLPTSKTSRDKAWENIQNDIHKNKFKVERSNTFERFIHSKVITRVAAVVGVLVGIYTLWFFSNDIERVTSDEGVLKYTFPDGSIALLKKGSSIQFLKTGFDGHIYLNGHAQFNVNDDGDSDHNFEVKTNRVVVIVPDGGQFDLRDDQHIFQLTNLGKSSISYIEEHNAAKKALALKSGEMLESFTTQLSLPMQRDISHTKWTEGSFSYYEAPLLMVIEDMEKHFDVIIEHELHSLDLIFTGKFKENSIEKALTQLCAQVPLDYHLVEGKVFLQHRK